MYDKAKIALQECYRVDEVKKWKDKAKAIATYAKMAYDEELYKTAARIQGRATQRIGELLRELDAQGKRTDKQPTVGNHGKLSQREVAKDAGLSEHQQLQAVRVASIPRAEFEKAIESDKPPSVTQLAEIGKKETSLRVALFGFYKNHNGDPAADNWNEDIPALFRWQPTYHETKQGGRVRHASVGRGWIELRQPLPEMKNISIAAADLLE